MLFYSVIVVVIVNVLGLIWAYTRQSDKLTDLIYGLCFVVMALLSLQHGQDFSFPKILLTGMITLWGLRLAGYLFLRISKTKTDARFDERRKDLGKLSFFWFLQTVSILIISLPVVIFLSKSEVDLGWVSYVGVLIWLDGFLIEMIADQQKFSFKNKPENKGKFMQSGLWQFSRHINYFGEILCWIGVFVFVAPFLQGWEWVATISPLWIIFLLTKVSGIPLLVKSAEEKYGQQKAFQEYKANVPLLIPFIGSKG